jgi:GTPase
MDSSLVTLRSLETCLGVTVTMLRERKTTDNEATPSENAETNGGKLIREYLIRKNYQTDDFIEVRVAVVGNVDSGKSTLLGVLTHSILDDGRGEARTKLFRHKHEIETGRTSSVGNDILGFDAVGAVVNDTHPNGLKNLDWESICRLSAKVLTFIDLAGHEKYLKTTVFGMTGLAPDFCMLMIGSNMGIIGMTKEHLGLSLALNVPVFVVLTKIDICPANVLQDTLNILLKILKSPGCRKLPYLVETMDDVVTCALNFTSERLCPIFQVSNVSGKNLDLLKCFLNLLNSRMEIYPSGPSEFQIDDLYSVPGGFRGNISNIS